MILKVDGNEIYFDCIKEMPEENTILLGRKIDSIPPYRIEVGSETLSDFGKMITGGKE